ncbi:MAG: toll/interleukin-1 receptor domain-containing protein [Bacteroidetes bacterium]|nr:toll/interleukin-1 receptor domain-containing protein [Bacteroidota bacterium]
MASFFISYSRRDAADMANTLRNHIVKLDSSHDVFLDVQSIKAGANWRDELKRKIIACDFFIYIHSPGSLQSKHVKAELNWVKESELKTGMRKLFVYRLHYAELTPDISMYQILDATGNITVDFYKLMSGIFSGNSFFNIEYELMLEDEFWYKGKVWIDAPRAFLSKIQMVEYRFDYGWQDKPLYVVKHSATAVKNKFKLPFRTKYHFTLFVMLYLWNTRELAFVKRIPICH